MTFDDRCVNAFLGLALGDAYGRPLEFHRLPQVRELPIDRDRLMWTDDTHMSLFLAEAVLEQGPDVLGVEAFGQAVGEAFVRWIGDPLTPSTAPGSTCMAGVQAWMRGGDWQTSGVERSDGCGAVMRIGPLPMALSGEDVLFAAEVQARLTHGHPNATEAAVAGSWILRRVLESGRLDEQLVIEAVAQLRGPWSRGGTVADSLEAAVLLAHRDEPWLDEGAVPEGDGGWRSGSALGLALAAALRWQDQPMLAVEKAARIDGDSDSVAAICGLLLGAAGAEWPEDWIRAIPQCERIEELASALAGRGRRYLAIADLHGHPEALSAYVSWAEEQCPDAVLVPLGDYCDNGPGVPALLESMVELKERLGERFQPILGNHDLACLRALDEDWYGIWRHYWNAGGRTPEQYGASDTPSFRAAFPADHRAFLESLPWFVDTGRYLFVHAGLKAGSIEPQLAELREKRLPANPRFMPQPLRDKERALIADPAWDRVVVSGHTKNFPPPAFVGPNRICLKSDSCRGGPVRAVLLPERRWLECRQGRVVRPD